MQADVTSGSWESRTLQGSHLQVWISENTSKTILLHMTNQPGQSLQMLVQQWTSQAMAQALLHAPDVLILQLMRYHMTAGGPGKLDVPILLHTQVQVPNFVDGILQCVISLIGFNL